MDPAEMINVAEETETIGAREKNGLRRAVYRILSPFLPLGHEPGQQTSHTLKGMVMNDPDNLEHQLLRRRALSRSFLEQLRKAARLRTDFKVALKELADRSQIVRHWAEDDLEEHLERMIDALIESKQAGASIESEISEADAADILDHQGAFEEHSFDVDEETARMLEQAVTEADEHPESLLPADVVFAEFKAREEERKRNIWQRSFANPQRALKDLRWSGFQGPVVEAYWNDPSAWISVSVGSSDKFLSSRMQVSNFGDPLSAAQSIFATDQFVRAVVVIHSEEERVRVERIVER
ncbi:MAG: hypothetical protein JO108_18655 [Acidobacteriaceae bacterium]|nr:hypothetical protein [Acidobacteriaceae bacterium]